MKRNWIQSGNIFNATEVTHLCPVLPKGIYKLEIDRFEQFYLSKTDDFFKFPYKVYGTEEEFIDRTEKTFKNTTGNIGILMDGVKGTGKTVTAQQICNRMGLPVIIVSQAFGNLSSFLNEINQDVVIFIDEYEKIFNEYNNSILTIMDGALKSTNRILFLLTSNDPFISTNMMQRPSRIRYIKKFQDLKWSVVEEVLDDLLKYPEFRGDCVKVISELSIITMDLVKSLIEEVNIHQESPLEFQEIFNIHNPSRSFFDISELVGGVEIPYKTDVSVNPASFSTDMKGRDFQIDRSTIGTIKRMIDEDTVEVLIYSNDEDDDDYEDTPKIFRIKPTIKIHRNYSLVV